MSSSQCWLGIIAVMLSVTGLPVAAQNAGEGPDLPQSVVTTKVPLSSTQKEVVDNYVDYWTQALIREQETRVPAAAMELYRPLKDANASAIFSGDYAAAVSLALEQAVAPDQQVVTRMNAMIILRTIAAPRVEVCLSAGLSDENPGVRYLAAMALGAIGDRSELTDEQHQALFAALKVALRSEEDQLVAGQMLVGMLGLLELPAARVELADGLNRRVEVRAENPNLAVDADLKALTELFRHLLRSDQKMPDELARAAFRIISASATALDEQADLGVNRGMVKQYRELILLADNVLREVVAAEGKPERAALENALLNGRYEVVVLQVGVWRELLVRPPHQLDRMQLEVRFP